MKKISSKKIITLIISIILLVSLMSVTVFADTCGAWSNWTAYNHYVCYPFECGLFWSYPQGYYLLKRTRTCTDKNGKTYTETEQKHEYAGFGECCYSI